MQKTKGPPERALRPVRFPLVISPKMVGTHIEHILSKLGVSSRAQAVSVAYREGFVDAAAPPRR